MSDPSRSLMESGEGARTILDESYVHTLDRKWGQLLEGIPGRNAQERQTNEILYCRARRGEWRARVRG